MAHVLGKRARQFILSYMLLLPALLLTLALMVYPMFMTISLSLRPGTVMNFSLIDRLPIGPDNYIDVITSPATWKSLLLALIYAGGSTGVGFIIGLGSALLLNKRLWGRRILRIFILTPWAVPGVLASIAFLWIFDASYGVFNYMLRSSGLISKNLAWFFDPNLAMSAVIIPTIWKGYPFFTLTLLAALQSIPVEFYEAARVDGAGRLGQFRWITWPGIRTAAVLALVLNGLWTFRVFDIIYPTTQGGPLGATETLAVLIYNEAFKFYHMGKAATLGMLTLFVCVVFVLVLSPLMKRKFF
jgi:multiple sugar transport system permease protein